MNILKKIKIIAVRFLNILMVFKNKKIVSRLEKNQTIRGIVLISLVLGAFITIGTFFININIYLYDNWFISKNITNQIKNLSAGQDIEYFKKYLGPQMLQREVSDDFVEYIFNYKGAYIQALVLKENKEVTYWAITDCHDNSVVLERPAFQNLTDKLYLNKSTFTDFFKKEKGDLEIFISAATANSFAYESVYQGNPGAYQTIIVGVNDICPTEDLYDHLDADKKYNKSNIPNENAINDFREQIKINTYAETAPFAGVPILEMLNNVHLEDEKLPYLNFGVDRIRVRYFSY